MSDEKLFCYCFEIPLDEARADSEATARKIRRRIAAEGCWCDVANPSGKCCLSQADQLLACQEECCHPPADQKETSSDMSSVAAVSTGLGAAAVATAASACCVPILAPLLVTAFGVSGSIWAASLAPYSPWIVLLAGLALGWARWAVYRPLLVEGLVCHSRPRPLLRVTFWVAAALWLLALGVNLMFKLGGARWLEGLAS